MAINILPASPDDISEMLSVGMKAFADNPLSKATFDMQKAPPEDVQEYITWRTALAKVRMNGPGKYYFITRDEETGAIVGYAGVNSPQAQTLSHSSVPRPKCMNTDVDDEFVRKQKSTREECLGDRKDVWYVQSMLVHPDFQGRGIAKTLLQRALHEADLAGQDVYLEGTAAGLSLYLRCGFEPLQDISVMNGGYVMKAMIRRPKKVVEQQ